jgi:CTP:molybdopterin cytidylyltransferase MocA
VDDVYGLAENEGLKNLIERQSRAFVDFPKSSYASDIDTPEDYRQLKEEQG